MKIVVASHNPVKRNAALAGFKRMFPEETWEVESAAVSSGVSEQPTSDTETFAGALQRAENASALHPDADFWIGIEGGVEEHAHGLTAFAWIVAKSKEGMIGKGKTGTFFLPRKVEELVRAGKELSAADDEVFRRENSGWQNGMNGILTHNVSDRTKYYTEGVILALIPFKNEELY